MRRAMVNSVSAGGGGAIIPVGNLTRYHKFNNKFANTDLTMCEITGVEITSTSMETSDSIFIEGRSSTGSVSTSRVSGKQDGVVFGDGTTDEPFSVCLWYRPTAISGSNDFITSTRSSTSKGNWQISVTNGDNTLRWRIFSENTSSNRLEASLVWTRTLNQWYHLCFTYDANGSGGRKIYIDGVEQTISETENGTYVAMEAFTDTSQRLTIGNAGFAATLAAVGDYDEFCVFDKELTQGEVTAIYDQGIANLPIIDDYTRAISYYPLSNTTSQLDKSTFNVPYSGTRTGSNTTGVHGDAIESTGSSESCFTIPFNKRFAPINNNDECEPFTFGGWFKIDTFADGQRFIRLENSSQIAYQIYNVSGNLEFRLYDGNLDDSDYVARRLVDWDTDYSTGTWYHYLFTADGSGLETGMKMYIDGVEVATTAINSNGGVALAPVQIVNGFIIVGGLTANTQGLRGAVDGIGFWNVELTAAQALAVYNNAVLGELY